MSISRRLLPALALTLAVGACENDMEPSSELTMEESVALLKGMGQEVGTILNDTTIVPIFVSPDSIVVACPQGGQAKIVGALTEELGDTARIVVNFQVTPTGCVVTGDGLEFTVDGGPSFVYQLTIEITASFEFNVTGSISGGLRWELGERSGNCDIALMLEATPDLSDPTNPGVSGMYVGTLCGHDVEVDAADLLVVDL